MSVYFSLFVDPQNKEGEINKSSGNTKLCRSAKVVNYRGTE